jgi:LmbE family N-acetylglucosaminyl deacetylase
MTVETLFLSPHHDDAVLSCGHWLEQHPGSIVATVFCASPGPGVPAGGWDGPSGFVTAEEACAAREAEDAAALAVVGAFQRRLPFCDDQYAKYRSPSLEDDVRAAVGSLLDELRPQRCFFPLGIRNEDHKMTRRVAIAVLDERHWCEAVAYAELPYQFSSPDFYEAALRETGLAIADGGRFDELLATVWTPVGPPPPHLWTRCRESLLAIKADITGSKPSTTLPRPPRGSTSNSRRTITRRVGQVR